MKWGWGKEMQFAYRKAGLSLPTRDPYNTEIDTHTVTSLALLFRAKEHSQLLTSTVETCMGL